MSQASVSIVIPAAGASERLGQPKQLVQYQGQSLICRAIRNAGSLSPHEILVITGASHEAVQAEVQKTNARCVFNPEWNQGMGTSIATGAQAVDSQSQGLMILLCDQWRILPEDLQQLIETWYDDPGRIICSATRNRCGPPVIFPATCLQDLSVLTGDRGAHTVMNKHRNLVLQVALENAASDLDTPAQLQQLHQSQS